MNKRRFLIAIGILAFGILFFLGSNLYVLGSTRGDIVASPETAYVIIVPGAGLKRDGTPSDVLRDRLKVAITLYKEGKGEKLLFSGDNGTILHDEVNAMREYTLAQGVPGEDIFLDHAGFDTQDTVYRARHLFGVTDAIVVTQNFHLPRILFSAEAQGIEVQGVSADLQRYVDRTRQHFREWLARPKAVLEALFWPKSKYGGEPIDIRGSGQVTWDKF